MISNVESAGGLAIARDAGIATKVIPHKAFASREAFDAAIDAALRAADVELVCLAGFMRILSDWFVRAGKASCSTSIPRCCRLSGRPGA